MTHNRVAVEMLVRRTERRRSPTTADTPSRWTRLRARMSARRLDDALERNDTAADALLSAHAAQITSFDEREQLARALRSMIRPAAGLSIAVPPDRRAVRINADLIELVALRLHAATPVRARGMARLRLLLSDGSGPLYQPGRGSLTAALRGVLAAL